MYYTYADIFLDRPVSGLKVDDYVVLRTPVKTKYFKIGVLDDQSVSGFGFSATVTGLFLSHLNGDELYEHEKKVQLDLKVRTTTVFTRSEKLDLAPIPITDNLAAGQSFLYLDTLVFDLSVGQRVAIRGQTPGGLTVSEIRTITAVGAVNGSTRLDFDQGLENEYLRDTVTINANIAHATHGETRYEILGSGDASQRFQAFTLQQTPLTYLQAATASGGSSTLEIRVNDILWHEVATLYGCKPKDRVYVTRMDDNGKVTVQFGDGKRGARLPTGNRNVVATYRAGTGPAGNLQAGQLTTLLSRPLGLREASNPVGGQGGSAPEPRELARENASLHVRTLDRAVSLLDYEDFARAFSGVGKAQAIWLWNGEAQIVHLTTAGDAGKDLKGTTVMSNLQKALNERRDPLVQVRVDTYAPIYFQIEAAVRVHADYDLEQVLTSVRDALRQAFSFEARQFGQAVARSEVIAVIQRVAGVEAVDLNTLFTDPQASDVNPAQLPAATAWWNAAAAKIELAQLLMVAETEAAIDLSELPA
jgi:predicted phage baseplate assembly protein